MGTLQRPLLIIVQGAPATGKSTLAHKLKKDLGIGLVSADDIKEYLFDSLGHESEAWSNALGKSLKPYLYDIVELALTNGQSVIYESAFWTEFAVVDMRRLIDITGVSAIELYCHATEDVRLERYNRRIADGTRHPGHNNIVGLLPDITKYGRIGVCEVINVDTNSMGAEQYGEMLDQIKRRMEV